MNDTFDPITLLIIAAAVIVFFKLRGVLGQRTGHDKPMDFPSPKPKSKRESIDDVEKDTNVIQMPTKTPKGKEVEPAELGLPPEEEVLSPANVKFADVLLKIRSVDPVFDPDTFVEGAKAAYEMIVTGFANGDKKTLKTLLSKDVLAGFTSAIDQRKSDGAEMSTQFVGIDEADVVNIELENKRAFVTARFVTELVSVVRDQKGNVIEGDPTEVQKIIDTWTFERDLSSKDPNWLLVSTDGEEA